MENSSNVPMQVWSSYKHSHTAKINVTAHSAGFFIHISDPYGGSISDDDLLVLCGVMEQLPPGSRLLLDKGYKKAKLLALEVNITVFTPPSRIQKVAQLEADKVASTARVAAPRVVIENLLARPKNTYDILSRPLPVAQLDMLGPILRVCCYLTNYMPPLRAAPVKEPHAPAAADSEVPVSVSDTEEELQDVDW